MPTETDNLDARHSFEQSTANLTRANNGTSPTWSQHESSDESDPLPLSKLPNESQALVRDIGRTKASRSPFSARLHDVLRELRLQILWVLPTPFSSWKTRTEQRKVAMYKSRTMALLHSVLHIVPLAGALTLLVLFWTEYFLGPTFEGTTALQFAAKLHELLMQASLASISLCIIRTLAMERYVPLGVLSGAAHTTQLSYLWSLDFWATIPDRGFRGRYKVLFLFMFPLLLSLTALVGPSAAVLMIPRPDRTHRNLTETVFGGEFLYPSSVIKIPDDDLSRDPRPVNALNLFMDVQDLTGWRTLPGGNTYRGENTIQYSMDSLIWKTRGPRNLDKDFQEPYNRRRRVSILKVSEYGPDGFTNASMTSHAATISTELSLQSLYFNATMPSSARFVWSVKTLQPVVQVHCRDWVLHSKSGNASDHVPYTRDDGSQGYLFTWKELDNILLSEEADSLNSSDSMSTTMWYKPIFSKPSETTSSTWIITSVKKVLWYPEDEKSRNATQEPWDSHISPYNETTAVVCEHQAFWKNNAVTTLSYIDASNDNIAVEVDALERWNITNPEDVRPINFDIDRVKYPLDAAYSQWSDPDFMDVDYSLAAACMFAEAIANIPYTLPWRREKTPEATMPYDFTQDLFGYGYGSTTTSDLLSVAVLATYCIVVVGYLVYSLITGSTSTAWNSPVELVALALQSNKPDHLGHTSVGIDSMETFRESVGIRVNQQNQVELVFAHDRDIEVRGLRKIERNKAY